MSSSSNFIRPSIKAIALALGGNVTGPHSVLMPAPGQHPSKRSLHVTFDPLNAERFMVNPFAGHDWRACKDHVRSLLRMPMTAWRRTEQAAVQRADDDDDSRRVEWALNIWNEARDARGTVVEHYLNGRGLELPKGADVIRFHPRCPWKDPITQENMRVPAMVTLYRSIHTDTPRAIQRTRLDAKSRKIGRLSLGPVGGCAIKIDADEIVTHGLHVAEGLESALAARQLGLTPCWSLGSAKQIENLPILGGIETLTIMAENDVTSRKAVAVCGRKWSAAGREVRLLTPIEGSDAADVVRQHREVA